MSQNKRFPHYWICCDCAEDMGGVMPQDRVCTIILGECKYCNQGYARGLIPWVDFDWPKNRKADLEAKVKRD